MILVTTSAEYGIGYLDISDVGFLFASVKKTAKYTSIEADNLGSKELTGIYRVTIAYICQT